MKKYKKLPFVHYSLRKKIKILESRDSSVELTRRIRTMSRNSTIIKKFVGFRFLVHNGRGYRPLDITAEMVGYKFGEFAYTRQRHIFKKKTKKKK